MNRIVTFIMLAFLSAAAYGQENDTTNYTNKPPCNDPACMERKFKYRFCTDKSPYPVEICTNDPNNLRQTDPARLRPYKLARPLKLCAGLGDLSSQLKQVVVNPSNSADPSLNALVFDLSDVEAQLNQAVAAWSALCPDEQKRNREYQNCCIQVVFSNEFTEYKELDPGNVRAFATPIVSDFIGSQGYCRLDCERTKIVINQHPAFLQWDSEGNAPKNFFYTRNREAVPEEYNYASFYSVMLHEIGHLLGLGHANGKDQGETFLEDHDGSMCSVPGSIMEGGEMGNWDGVDRDIRPEDICAFMKLHCCSLSTDKLEVIETEGAAPLLYEVVEAGEPDRWLLRFAGPAGEEMPVQIATARGDVVLESAIMKGEREFSFATGELSAGAYFIRIRYRGGVSGRSFVIRK